MNIDNKFHFIHMPKTGGTFVVYHLKDFVVDPKVARIQRILGRLFAARAVRDLKHARRVDLRNNDQSMPLVGCIRNPFDWYVSNYTFEWWKDYPDEYPGVLEHENYPDLSFSEYLTLSFNEWHSRLPNVSPLIHSKIGRYTQLIIWWFCQNPQRLLSWSGSLDEWERQVRRELDAIRFLRTEVLNDDLSQLLEEYRFPISKINEVKKSNKVYPKQHKGRKKEWREYYSGNTLRLVSEKDRFIFKWFEV